MKYRSKQILISLLTVAALWVPCSLAESITFTGTVAASDTREVYAPIGGTVETVNVESGQKVKADDA